jgi:anaerobic selenocysteine-containing dehydrogenase
MDQIERKQGISRRAFMRGMAATGAAGMAGALLAACAPAAPAPAAGGDTAPAQEPAASTNAGSDTVIVGMHL